MKPVEILTIKNKIPLFKGDEEANAIELIQLEEVGFEIVAQKGLYDIGDKAVYIQPDYSLSDIPLFESFLRPQGDPKKSKLGSSNRIRAVKFNLHRGDGLPVYSLGILLPYHEVYDLFPTKGFGYERDTDVDLTELLEITKWEAPDNSGSGLNTGRSTNFPSDMYHTDEENINNLWNKIYYPITLIGSEKCDGSSISLWYKRGESGICSRKLGKPLTCKKVVGREKLNFIYKFINWCVDYKPDLNIYNEVENDDDFVKIGKPYLDKLVEFCKRTGQDFVLRGELNGEGLKGSGNKNNPDVKNKPNIKFFGLDNYVGFSTKEPEKYFNWIVCDKLGFTRCKVVFNKTFNSKEELLEECNNYFKDHMIEGIVVRTLDSQFSAKIMNLEYDSKK